MPFEIPESIKYGLQFVHPLMMWLLLALALYALYTGVKVRQTRSADGETKKALIQGKFPIKHHQIGAIWLAFMVLGTIGGMAVTYLNNGKLFISPHLLVGLAMTGLAAASAAFAPFMQKGADWARYSHIALNISLVGLFGWQAVTGVQIVQKILNPS